MFENPLVFWASNVPMLINVAVKEHYMTYRKAFYFILLTLTLLFTNYAQAQIEVSSGIDITYPLLLNQYNSRLNYNQFNAGMHFGISYKPANTQFFPTLDFAVGRTRYPITQFENNDAYINFNYTNLVLNGNFVVAVREYNTLYLIGGIGFSQLNQKGVGISGSNGDAMSINLDSTKNLDKRFPLISLGFEYVYGEKDSHRPVYLSFGFKVQYTYLFAERNTYFVSVQDAQRNYLHLQGSLIGRVYTPLFYVSIHYMLGNSIMFWKKKNSMYLN